jgi:ribosomal protein S18 acetylase RimI-like enzyme
VSEHIYRKYLEMKSLSYLKEVKNPNENYEIKLVNPTDFQLNKFLYKYIGKKYHWIDRLSWTDKTWFDYVSNSKLSTYTLKNKEDLVGYFELIYHKDKKECEIVYFGILEEYFGKKLGGFLLSEAIKKSFKLDTNRVWLHTCSLDHENALKNYLSRGMSVFKSEIFKK